ncbi:MAG TPA: NfeD family protein [Solirubrobacteraceae bacterium]|nr:NfeD family protein [Solirubrobacteraceae bacterium]
MSEIGLLLVLVGAALLAAEAHLPSHGLLGTAAAASLAVGIGMLVSAAGLGTAAVVGATLAAALVSLALVVLIARKAFATRRLRARTGAEGLIGRLGEVRSAPAPVGRVFVDGALWRARRWDLEDGRELEPGDPVVIERVSGLTLTVRPAEEWEVAP